MTRTWIGLVLVLLAPSACGDPTPARPPVAAVPTVTPEGALELPGDLEAPPPVIVSTPDRAFELHAWTFCYASGCADGIPPAKHAHVGDAAEVVVDFPLPEWSFTASFQPAGEQCGRIQRTRLDAAGDGRFVLRPVGHAGIYDVTLAGRGDGDLFVTFRWETPVDGPLAQPRARLAVVSDDGDDIVSYGVELSLTNLDRTPEEASATITVRAAGGDELTFDATRAAGRCLPEGSVYWDGPDDMGAAAARLGDAPFDYEVVVVLDGERYVGRATWPGDEIVGNEPSAELRFTPDLPAPS